MFTTIMIDVAKRSPSPQKKEKKNRFCNEPDRVHFGCTGDGDEGRGGEGRRRKKPGEEWHRQLP